MRLAESSHDVLEPLRTHLGVLATRVPQGRFDHGAQPATQLATLGSVDAPRRCAVPAVSVRRAVFAHTRANKRIRAVGAVDAIGLYSDEALRDLPQHPL